ncbi:filamentous hemagglutinin N-terminal domain-containing protein, partial [Salmonella enterica]
MNKIYRLRFDRRRNALVVVSEITTGAGKEKNTGHVARLPGPSSFVRLMGTLTPLALLTGFIISLFPGGVVAADLPIGGQIVGGQGSISTSGNQMTIHQQTQNMATNWHSFDVGKNSIVQFVQPDSSSVALNRVTGASGSQIMGTLKANGQVFILNPSGVLFGKDARVNVGGLVASTKNINTADFMKGQYTLSGEGNPGAQVVNQGSLTTTKGGYIVLAGERVSNSGVTTTPGGKMVLAAGKTVTLQLDNGGLTSVSVNGSVVNALVENQGLISATDGRVFLTAKGQDMLLNTVVNNSGTIEAKGLASRGGEIVLDGGESGVVSQSGQLLADSHTGQGGKVILEGQNIYLAGGSLTSATGQTGGGEVYVGGGWQGKDSRIKNASKVVMDKAVTVDVSATDAGNGGTAVLWSDDYTNFRGSILAQGGAQSGNGGRVETSSHRNLQVSGTADASARAGHGGEWLLDPTDVTITGTGTDTGVRTTGKGSDLKLDTDTEHLFTPTASGAQILNTSIENQLNNGTAVIVKTSGFDVSGQSGNITVNANITKTGGADAALTLEADGNITVNKNITSTVGRLNISLLAAGSDSGRIQVLNSTLNSNGGNITLGQLNPTTVAEDGSSISNPNALTVKVNNSTLNASATTGSAGDILISARNPNVNLSQAKYNNTVRNGAVMLELSGNSVLSGGSVTLNAEQSGGNASQLPWYLNNATVNATGDILFSAKMTGGNGAVSAEIRNTSNLTAGGNITLISDRAGGNIAALLLNGSAADAIKLTAGKNITLTGVNQGTASAINVKNTALTAGSNITLTGNSTTGTGLSVTGSKLNASHAAITGTSTGGSTGFSLTNTTLSGALADLTNVTLSSAGSGAGAVNILDSSVVTATNRDTLMKMGIENMTSVDMGGAAIFDDSNETDKKGWTANYSMEGLPNHGWIFNHTSVKAGGPVQLTGVGFSNSTINVTTGGLNISQMSPLQLTNTTMNVNGSVLLHSGADINLTSSRVNETSTGDAAVNITAGQNMTLSGTNITAGAGKLNISLLAAGSDSGRIQVLNSKLTSNGGDIVIDQLNPVPTATDSSKNPNALTVKVNNSTLNASAGDILISARNPNVNLSQAKYNNTVRNGAALLELSGNSALSGRDLVMHTTLEGASAAGLPVFMNNATLTASRDITLRGTPVTLTTTITAADGTQTTNTSVPGVAAIELRGGGNVLNATGNITIENQASGNNNGIYLNGNATGKVQLTAGGNITLNGSSAGGGTGVLVSNGNLSATSANINLTGSSKTGTGVSVTNSTLNATHAAITGTSASGTGFSLTNTTLNGALADLTNVTLSSAGSGAGATNLLDSSVVVNATIRDTLMKKRIENMTAVDMGGVAIFDYTTATESDGKTAANGWTANYSMADLPSHGWIFSNTSVKAGGDVDLKGVGFTNATVDITQGNLSIDNGGLVLLTGSDVSVVNGSVNLHSADGSIDLSKGNLTAKNNITVTASNGTVTVTGVNATDTANITSEAGNITLKGHNPSTERVSGVALTNATLTASQGNITINGTTPGTFSGVRFRDVNLTANTTTGSINAYGESAGVFNSLYDERGSLYLWGANFTASDIQLQGKNTNTDKESIAAGFYIGGDNTFNGNAALRGEALTSVGVAYVSGTSTLTFNASRASLTGIITGESYRTAMGYASGGIVAIVASGPAIIKTILNGTSFSMNGTVTKGDGYGIANTASNNAPSGFIFEGTGNVNITAQADSRTGLDVRTFDNTGFTGSFTATGRSNTGAGIVIMQATKANLVNASLHGESQGDTGIFIQQSRTSDHFVDLNNNTLNGTSATGQGVVIIGNNVTLTNGTLTGTATSGNGSGVSLTGGSNYTIDGATVTGQSADGTGVSVSGNLTVNNNARLNGAATGNGSGVSVNGTLASEGGVSISGTATIGDGVQVAGNTQLNNATVSGSSTDGSGIHVGGNLTNSNTTLSGSASGQGSGVEVGGNITGGTITGNAASGSGVLVSGEDSTVTDAVLKGNTDSGTGVSISGNLTNAGSTTVSGNAGSSGTGVDLSGNVTGGSVTGNSVSGSGISVSGGDSVATNTALNGSSAGGTGVAISGNLTNAGTTTVSGNTEGSGAGVALSGSVTGGAVSGTSASGSGVTINGTVNSTVNGQSESGTGVQLNEGAEVTGTGQVSGGSVSGNGVSVSGHVTSNGAVKGESSSGNGTVISGSLTGNDSATITGSTTGNGNGLYLDGTVAGGRVSGSSVGGDAVHLGDGAQVSDANVSGT